MSPYLAAGSLILLFITQRLMTRHFSVLVHRLGGGHNTIVWVWSLIFIPGTLLHEVSHLLVAAISGARTGKIDIFPEFLDETGEGEGGNGSVRLGSVQVQTMNPLQGFLVGLAPFLTGSVLLVFISTLIIPAWEAKEYLKLALEVYIFFTVANSFFPSKEDFKHTLPMVFIFIVAGVAFWYFGFKFSLGDPSHIFTVLNTLGTVFIASSILNLVIILIISIANRLVRVRRFV